MLIPNPTILVVEDEPAIRKLLSIALEGEGFTVITADKGTEGVRAVAASTPDLVVLDLGLPDIDGKMALSQIREFSQVPVIICTVRADDSEVLEAFELGADDYVTKPFNPEVLIARIQANLRTSATVEPIISELVNGEIRMDLVRHEVFVNDQKVTLTPKEYELLQYFMNHRGKMLTHRQILKDVWGPEHSDDMQYLRVYVSQLREKCELGETRYFVTEPGIGYRMESMKPGSQAAPAQALSA